MNCLIWNSRGTGAKSFPGLVRDLKIHYQLNFVAILETRCNKETSHGRANQLGFPSMEIIECERFGVYGIIALTLSLLLNGTINIYFYRFVEQLGHQLWKELEDVLLQESLLWAQKARAEWSVYGDRNTRYFHARANRRRKSQRIEAIKDEEGAWKVVLESDSADVIELLRNPLNEAHADRGLIEERVPGGLSSRYGSRNFAGC
ncbi:hypothetical protein K1719_043048 [Acacia pycnantha]|nr:hypothetical protein K1719_043048 [Acacia pycnantha]